MRANWPLWLFSAIAFAGVALFGFNLLNGSVRLCGRTMGCVTYRLAETPGRFLLASFPALLLMIVGGYGAYWWVRITGRR